MDADSGSSWMLDSLICFLNGPIWNAPLESFIEERSIIFERNVEERPEYRIIFEEFKNLVRNTSIDLMLGTFMEDVGISPDEFERACLKTSRALLSSQMDCNLFQMIWAANDYEMFKNIMLKKNVELHLQALQLLERKYGLQSSSKALEEAVDMEMLRDNESSLLNELFQHGLRLEPATRDHEEDDDDITLVRPKSSETSIDHDIAASQPAAKQLYSDTDVKKRQDYLKAQRDKLVAMKKQVRKKCLDETPPSEGNERPKTAKAAERILTGDKLEVEPHILAARKKLAEKLRTELIGKP